MLPQHNDNNLYTMDASSSSRRRRKRARPLKARKNHLTMPEASLMTSLLWLVAFTASNTCYVKAFVLANNRPPFHHYRTTSSTRAASSGSLFASALAEVEVGSSSSSSTNLDKLLDKVREQQHEEGERPEDVLDLANHPLLLLPNHHYNPEQQQQHSSKDNTPTITTSSSPVESAPGVSLVSQLNIPNEEEVLEWAERYTSVEALREHFGTNQNKLWGDLQASTARRLYKNLLPRALLELSKLECELLKPQDLAPLAYQARVAAKLYARERSTVPARIAATLFDGFRQWIKYGKFQAHGMTYDQLWEKYADKILQETDAEQQGTVMDTEQSGSYDGVVYRRHHHVDDDDEECNPFYDSDCEDLSEQVCRKILERACVSNEAVDAMALQGQDLADETDLQPHQRRLLEQIRSQLEQDMYQLLLPPGVDPPQPTIATSMPQFHSRHRRRGGPGKKFRLVKSLAKQRRLWKLKKAQRELAKLSSTIGVNGNEEKSSGPKAWLSRSSRKTDDIDEDETLAQTDDETEDSDDEWKP